MQTSRELTANAPVSAAPRVARRRRVMWAATALLAVVGGAIALWPAHDRYRASAVVEAGDLNTQGLPVTTLEYNWGKLLTAESLTRVKESLLNTDVLRVHVTTTASSEKTAIEQVRSAVTLLQATLADSLAKRPGPRRRAAQDLAAATKALRTEQARAGTLEQQLAEFNANYDTTNLAQQVQAAEGVYNDAVKSGNENAIATAKRTLDETKARNATHNELVAKNLAATSAVANAIRKHDNAQSKLAETPAESAGTVKVSPIQDEQIAEGRPASRLSLAAIMLVIAIAAADALFLTRVKFAVPSADAPVPIPERLPPPEPAMVPEPVRVATPNRRRHPRRRRERVAASPLDLPNIEVHLLDREGGLRAIRLRDAAAGTEATNLQQPQEQ
jgi:hypothetical protein